MNIQYRAIRACKIVEAVGLSEHLLYIWISQQARGSLSQNGFKQSVALLGRPQTLKLLRTLRLVPVHRVSDIAAQTAVEVKS